MAAGYRLSFASVATILYAMSGRTRTPDRWWRTSERIHVAVAVGLTPIVLMLFGQNPLLGPLANAVAVPWVSFIVVPLVLLVRIFGGNRHGEPRRRFPRDRAVVALHLIA